MIIKNIYKIFAILSLMALININAFAQCCSAGNPASLNVSGAGSTGLFNVNLNYIYSNSDTYYNGTEKLDKKYLTSNFKFASLGLSYNLSDKFKITSELGYFLSKSQIFDASSYERKADGLGDMSLGFSYSTYKSKDKTFEVIQSGKITIPVGTVEQEFDGVILPIDLQPASGANKYTLGLAFLKSFGKSGFSLISANSFETSQTIETKNTSHKYGNLYNVSLGLTYSVNSDLSALVKLRMENREQALTATKLNDGSQIKYTYINASGGTFVHLAPAVNYRLHDNLFANVEFNLPIYKNVNGEQLTNSYYFSVGISKGFNLLGQDEKCETSDLESKDLNSISLKVSGACDMCKDRIEELVKESKFVSACEWSAETQILVIKYSDSIPDLNNIAKALADVGHDNEKFKAKDEVYNKLPACCKYRK